jgi:biofilm protein TabA
MRRRDLFIGLAASGLLSRLATAKADDTIVVPLDRWKTLANVKGLEPAFEYLSKLDPAQLTPGRTPILGDDVYASVSKYATRAIETSRFEVHQKYIDVQYVVSGQETIGFCPSVEGLNLIEPYNAQKDVAFYTAPASYTRLEVRAGYVAVLRPGQAHMPNCHLDGVHDVVKVVVKVNLARTQLDSPK